APEPGAGLVRRPAPEAGAVPRPAVSLRGTHPAPRCVQWVRGVRICSPAGTITVMGGDDHLLGVRAGSPAPVSRPDVPPLPLPGPAPPEPPAWPAAAQWCAAGLVGACLALLAWRGWGLSRYSARPLPLERSAAIDLNAADEIDLQQ